MHKIGLSDFLGPGLIEEFKNAFLKNRPFFINDRNQVLESLKSLPFLNSLEDLVLSWPFPIQAHLPDARDEASSIDTTAKDALKLFNNGMGLLFNEINLISPVLHNWLEGIKIDLGLPAMTYGRCLIYATPHGKGTATHFDQNLNLVLQIKGTKIWKMAPNHEVINPTVRHTIGMPLDPELASYSEISDSSLPEDFETYELKPGSLLFVPRGYWHCTEAEGDALALNFTFTAPTWSDIFLTALRTRLLLSPEWRETAYDVASVGDRKSAEIKLDLLLASLLEDVPYWRAADILDVTDPQ